MRFLDFHYEMAFDLVTEKEFEQEMNIEHKDCNMDSETIVNNPRLHIERVICYDHQLDWFFKVEPYPKEQCRLVNLNQ